MVSVPKYEVVDAHLQGGGLGCVCVRLYYSARMICYEKRNTISALQYHPLGKYHLLTPPLSHPRVSLRVVPSGARGSAFESVACC